jgi:hypothetical protein
MQEAQFCCKENVNMSSVFGTVKVCCGGRDGEIPGEAPIVDKSANFSWAAKCGVLAPQENSVAISNPAAVFSMPLPS